MKRKIGKHANSADDTLPFEPPEGINAHLSAPKELKTPEKKNRSKSLAPIDRQANRSPHKGEFCGAPRSVKNIHRGEGTCRMPAGWGTDHYGEGHCAQHGGNNKRERIKLVKELVEKKLKQGVYGDPQVIDPDTALLMEVHRTAGHVEWLRQRIQEIGETKGDSVLMQYTDAFGMGASVWVDMYQKERQHLVRVAKAAIDAGVAVRQVEIAEQQARMMAMVMISFIEDEALGLDYRQKLNARKLMRKHLEGAQVIELPDLPTDAEVEQTIYEAELVAEDMEVFE